MSFYDHLCGNCKQEFELEYSVHASVPTICPLCNHDGQVKRLITYATPGKVELTGHDLKSHLKAEGKKLKAEAMRNENTLANLVGESKFQSNTKQLEKDISNLERVKIRSKK